MALTVLGLLGSLRKASLNGGLMRAAGEVLPDGMSLTVGRIDDLPPDDADLDARGLPGPVARLKGQIAAADAVLIVSPEYNYSVPGTLKNALDWVSRKPDPPFDGKPVAIMGASSGMFGTVRMQAQLRQIGLALNMRMLSRPEVMVSRAQEKFDASGRLVDERTRELVREAMAALAAWTVQIRG